MDLEMEMEMELSGSGSGPLDGLPSFAGVDDERDQKPQHSGHEQADGGQQQSAAASNSKKKRYHRHTAHQIQQIIGKTEILNFLKFSKTEKQRF